MSEPPASPDEASPQPVVAEHELVRPIGAGAGGEVWLAKSALGTYRAVKVVYRKTFSWAKAYEDEFHGLLKY